MRQLRMGAFVLAFSAAGSPAGAQSTSAASQPAAASRPASAPSASAVGAGDLLAFQDIPVVVAASRHEQRVSIAPADVTVVTAEEIELYGHRNLTDILRTQRGFVITTDGLNQFLGVRGFLRPGEWNARILVLVDGRRTREPIYGQTHLDQDFVVPVELIKRVEIIRGPSAALYGSNAVFAVINIITRDGADVKNWAELKVQGGTQRTGRALGVAGRKFDNGLDILLGASRFTSEGDKNIHYFGVHDADRNYGFIRNHDFEGAGSALWKMTYQEFTFEADFMKRDRDNRTARYLSLWTDPGRMTEQRDDLSIRWDHKVTEGQSLHAQTFFSRYAYDEITRFDDGGGPYSYWSTARSDWFGEDVHYDWQVNRQNRLIIGAEAMQAVRANQKDSDAVNGTVLDLNHSLNWWALYAKDEYTPADWLTLVAGLRMDKIQRLEPLFNPSVAAVITPNRTDTFKFLYGQAFRAPNLYEMFYRSSGFYEPNPSLKPEASTTYEALWGHEYKSGWHSEAGYYLWQTTDALGDGLSNGALQTQNVGTIWGTGLEGELSRKWSNGARLRATASFGRVTDEKDQRATHSPDWVFGLAGAYPVLNERTFLALETQIVGPQRNDLRESSNASFLTHAVLTSRNVWKGLDLQVGVYNLFGQWARVPRTSVFDHSQPWLREPGLSFLVSATYRF